MIMSFQQPPGLHAGLEPGFEACADRTWSADFGDYQVDMEWERIQHREFDGLGVSVRIVENGEIFDEGSTGVAVQERGNNFVEVLYRLFTIDGVDRLV